MKKVFVVMFALVFFICSYSSLVVAAPKADTRTDESISTQKTKQEIQDNKEDEKKKKKAKKAAEKERAKQAQAQSKQAVQTRKMPDPSTKPAPRKNKIWSEEIKRSKEKAKKVATENPKPITEKKDKQKQRVRKGNNQVRQAAVRKQPIAQKQTETKKQKEVKKQIEPKKQAEVKKQVEPKKQVEIKKAAATIKKQAEIKKQEETKKPVEVKKETVTIKKQEEVKKPVSTKEKVNQAAQDAKEKSTAVVKVQKASPEKTMVVTKTQKAPIENRRLVITVTTSNIGEIVRVIAGNKVDLRILADTSRYPNNSDITQKTLISVSESDIVLYQSGEKWIDQIKKESTNIDYLTIKAKGNLMNPSVHLAAAQEIRDILSQKDKKNKEFYEEQYNEYVRTINPIIGEAKARLIGSNKVRVIASNQLKDILVSFGFNVIATYDGSKSITQTQREELIKIGKRNNVDVVIDDLQAGVIEGKKLADDITANHIVISNFILNKSYMKTLRDNLMKLEVEIEKVLQ